MEFHYEGIILGLCAFVCIGLFHPLVIKGEYYFGAKRCGLVFPIFGTLAIAGSLMSESNFISALLGVFAFSCFWSVIEVFEQEKRVQKGWFPKNPKRKYYFDEK